MKLYTIAMAISVATFVMASHALAKTNPDQPTNTGQNSGLKLVWPQAAKDINGKNTMATTKNALKDFYDKIRGEPPCTFDNPTGLPYSGRTSRPSCC